MQLTANTVVAEKYEIIDRLGAGGMGVVYRARQTSMDRVVALKFLNCSADDAEALARFKREAQIMSTLHHRNLLASYELGTWKSAVYLTMEYAQGQSLQNLLAKGALPVARAMDVGRQIADALSCAHAHGVIHRDLKPSNVLLTKGASGEDLVKVIDFGLAKLTSGFGRTVQKLTETGYAVGSVLYMSPEQCLGKGVDTRSDIYGLGAVLYHCLTGQPPFSGEHSIAVMHQHLEVRPKPITEVNVEADFPIGLDTLVARCLAKDSEERYQTANDVMAALDMVAAHEGRNLTTFVPQVPKLKQDEKEEETKPARKPFAVTAGQRRTFYAALAAMYVLGVVVAIFLLKWFAEEVTRKPKFAPRPTATTEVTAPKDHQPGPRL